MARMTCPGCQRKIPVTAEDAGVTLECSRCGATMQVPPLLGPGTALGMPRADNQQGNGGAVADDIPFVCPECGKRGHAPLMAAGKMVSCPRCKRRVKVPSLDEAVAPVLEPLDASEFARPALPLAGESPAPQVAEAPARFQPAAGYRCPFCGTAQKWVWQHYFTTIGKLAMVSFTISGVYGIGLTCFLAALVALRMAGQAEGGLAMITFGVLLALLLAIVGIGLSVGMVYLAYRYVRARRQICPDCGIIVGPAC